MKRSIYLGLMVLLVCGLSACDNYNYYIAARNKTNMSGYHTFAWMPGVKVNATQQADAAIKSSATTALQGKGLALQQQRPDLLVSYTVTVGRGTRTDYYTPGWYGSPYWGWGGGFGWGWRGWYGGPYYAFGGPFAYYGGLTYAEQEHYKEGTVIIDLIDRRTQKVVWRGFGVGEVHHNEQKNIDDLPKVVDGILKQLNVGSQGVMIRTMNS